ARSPHGRDKIVESGVVTDLGAVEHLLAGEVCQLRGHPHLRSRSLRLEGDDRHGDQELPSLRLVDLARDDALVRNDVVVSGNAPMLRIALLTRRASLLLKMVCTRPAAWRSITRAGRQALPIRPPMSRFGVIKI